MSVKIKKIISDKNNFQIEEELRQFNFVKILHHYFKFKETKNNVLLEVYNKNNKYRIILGNQYKFVYYEVDYDFFEKSERIILSKNSLLITEYNGKYKKYINNKFVFEIDIFENKEILNNLKTLSNRKLKKYYLDLLLNNIEKKNKHSYIKYNDLLEIKKIVDCELEYLRKKEKWWESSFEMKELCFRKIKNDKKIKIHGKYYYEVDSEELADLIKIKDNKIKYYCKAKRYKNLTK